MWLNLRTAPKGTIVSPIRRAIVAWLREHGPATAHALRAGLLARGGVDTLLLEQRHPHWAEDHTYELFYAGHLQRDKPAGGGPAIYRVAAAHAGGLPSAPTRSGDGAGLSPVGAGLKPAPTHGPSTGRGLACNAPAVPACDAGCADAVGRARVAAPRRVQRLYGPLLQGEHAPPVREGAQDYAAIPSLVLGKRVPYARPSPTTP